VPAHLYSHSRLSTFENCPRKFEYRYVQRIPRDTESIEAFVGKRVHEILERLYHHLGRHGRPPSLRQVLDRYGRDWTLHWHEEVAIVREDRDAESYRLQGERCLENYYRKNYPFEDGETVGIEHRVSIRLDDQGIYKARGIIDRLVRTAPGTYEIHDYKTSASLPPRERVARDRQLSLYQIGIEQGFPDAEQVELVWHYVAFGKTIRLTRSPEALEALRGETIQQIEAIEQTTEFVTRQGPLCRWCEYRDICPDAPLGAPARQPTSPVNGRDSIPSGAPVEPPSLEQVARLEPPSPEDEQLPLL
jgi:putative RecB family exonuclease